MKEIDVLIIGAGPSGAIASALLHKQGNLKILVVEKEHFPRFVIGESLLPVCMEILEEAGFLKAVKQYGFQFKNGAAFSFKDKYRYFNFCDKSAAGYGTTFQVQRADFDELLINEAIKQGILVLFGTSVQQIIFPENTEGKGIHDDYVQVQLSNKQTIKTKFILDASGYGRVIARLLNLETPSNLSTRKAYFTHIQDNITEPLYDRNKILITTHPENHEIWSWLIPFSNGRCSIGVVGSPQLLDKDNHTFTAEKILKKYIYHAPLLKRLLSRATWDMPVQNISAYSKNIKRFYGERFIILGNAGEFLDPVFSSGVAIAMYSARLASALTIKIFNNEIINLEKEYTKPLMLGINTFRAYIQSWYDGSLQRIIYTQNENYEVKRQMGSILAGYVWDINNPYITKSQSSLQILEQYCKK
ncbi:NAD(P)/FAD-dependent oxidoreductase [Helicobacter aurati]|uniref:NAD(P)/FAD-dependent oxidoreductase n=1 Tax=Helicobacter aurati TaxID=137778 RepID=UPI0018F8202F|nr:NAD(P)/FAD-dependent oxidoreductase [Helicobacter aurati]